jgi:hypothetical protein
LWTCFHWQQTTRRRTRRALIRTEMILFYCKDSEQKCHERDIWQLSEMIWTIKRLFDFCFRVDRQTTSVFGFHGNERESNTMNQQRWFHLKSIGDYLHDWRTMNRDGSVTLRRWRHNRHCCNCSKRSAENVTNSAEPAWLDKGRRKRTCSKRNWTLPVWLTETPTKRCRSHRTRPFDPMPNNCPFRNWISSPRFDCDSSTNQTDSDASESEARSPCMACLHKLVCPAKTRVCFDLDHTQRKEIGRGAAVRTFVRDSCWRSVGPEAFGTSRSPSTCTCCDTDPMRCYGIRTQMSV